MFIKIYSGCHNNIKLYNIETLRGICPRLKSLPNMNHEIAPDIIEPDNRLAFRATRSALEHICKPIPKIHVLGEDNIRDIYGRPSVWGWMPHVGHSEDGFALWTVQRFSGTPVAFPGAIKPWYKNRLMYYMGQAFAPMIPMPRVVDGATIRQANEALEQLTEFLKSGYSIILASEGTRSNKTIPERSLHKGVAQLLLKAGVPYVPMQFRGFSKIQTKGQRLPRLLTNDFHRHQAVIYLGSPVEIAALQNPNRSDRTELANKLKECHRQMSSDLDDLFPNINEVWE